MNTTHVIVDGHNMLYRQNHTVGFMSLPDGAPCGAAWGTVRSILTFAGQESGKAGARRIVVHLLWDGGRSPRRLTLLPTYKASRKRNQTEERKEATRLVLEQADMVNSLLLPLGVRCYRASGVEADDVAAALVEALAPDDRVVLLSGDTDWSQLVRRNVEIVHPDKGRTSLSSGGGELGSPREIVTLKMIAGDRSDDIPGVPTVGDKLAHRVLDHYREQMGLCDGIEPDDFLTFVLRKPGSLPLPADKRTATAWSRTLSAAPTLARNQRLIDLRHALRWDEVWQAAETPAMHPADYDEFARRCARLGWRGLGPLHGVAERLARWL